MQSCEKSFPSIDRMILKCRTPSLMQTFLKQRDIPSKDKKILYLTCIFSTLRSTLALYIIQYTRQTNNLYLSGMQNVCRHRRQSRLISFVARFSCGVEWVQTSWSWVTQTFPSQYITFETVLTVLLFSLVVWLDNLLPYFCEETAALPCPESDHA